MSTEILKNDIEETDNLGDKNFVDFLNKKQRELLTSTVDYNLESISQLITKKTIDLAPKYQRRFRWDEGRKAKLIESFLMNVPIPPIFLNEDDLGKYSVIDGKQRLSAINEYLSGKLSLTGLEVFKDLNGLTFFDLPLEFQNSLKIRANLRAIIILRQSDKDIKYEVFQRLNTGGVKLNAQEIRNSAFPGKLNDKILELSENRSFHKLLGIKSKTKSKIYQEMKDAELVLRFFALKDHWANYSGGLKKILDAYLDNNQSKTEAESNKFAKEFLETLEKVELIFGTEGSFRRWIPENKKWKQQVSAPLFDAQMFACYKKDKKKIQASKEKILSDFKLLFSNDRDFLQSIESSTGTPNRFLYRTNKLNDIIKENI
ncbi:hypothetical protein CHRY9390_00052 [Chryseobacterium aquaeductus]|uniref:GmrSD restriction endonucleases N-terminal domain-containing protein n=1 Tax=Chryseobacterium aquaeductus TaxID=2675056 RepID=A0A9N8MCX6_9FLAO|nr:DUF262 domain-containing protein [Chryseobacterium aquaeductus]CAA7329416.1 hypothetical protein CHRY9390_00052 [Chryseobacterium potabilaquae]CAD7796749.1 hypothetical protein CHRY9390_00052 [Chryseobacterium aquaeductus]